MALPGPAAFPGLPAGAEASVTSFALQSTGQVSGDLTRQIPAKSSSKGSGDGTFAVSASGQRLTLVQHMTIDITISPA